LLKDVVATLLKMSDNLQFGADGRMHLKNDQGGVADIEFLVQYLVLANCSPIPRYALLSRQRKHPGTGRVIGFNHKQRQ